MRYIIYETTNQKVFLKDEIGFLKNYVGIESMRYNSKITVNFDVQGIEDNDMIEPLLLLPFIENVFKHGVSNEINSGFAEIIIVQSEGQLILQTRNSKPSVRDTDPITIGTGLKNVVERLSLLYTSKHSLVINDEEKNYEAILTIKLS